LLCDFFAVRVVESTDDAMNSEGDYDVIPATYTTLPETQRVYVTVSIPEIDMKVQIAYSTNSVVLLMSLICHDILIINQSIFI